MVLLAGCPTIVGKPFKPQPVQPFEYNQKYLVGMLNMTNVSGDASTDALVMLLVGAMISEIQANEGYYVIERERLESLLRELELSLSEQADRRNAENIGKLLDVEALCFINLSSVADKTKRAMMPIACMGTKTVETATDAPLVSVATGEILASAKSTVVKGCMH